MSNNFQDLSLYPAGLKKDCRKTPLRRKMQKDIIYYSRVVVLAGEIYSLLRSKEVNKKGS